ncbi:unnamed protein product [marine sediment metagenome]|uniref:SEC-C motif domain protein n=1 Tax=marine sediment metagenome TaxID=412755 RepID=X1VAZ9_9ZZZZ
MRSSTPPQSFVTSYKGISRVLHNQVHITEAFNPSTITGNITPQNLGAKEYIAIWDTGATGSIITKKVVNDLGLKPIGITQLYTANDKRVDAPQYHIAIFLPNRVYVHELVVTEATVTGDAEILIGMDIINAGDFAVTNKDRKTVFSFRTPYLERIDFTKRTPPAGSLQVLKPSPKVGRNDPCPCGSGKKFKKCHGR